MNAIHLVVEQKPFTSHVPHTPVWCGANRSLPNPNKYSSVAHINYFDSNSTPRQIENSQIDLQCTPNCQSITTIRCARSLLQTTVKNSNGVYPVAVVRCYVSHTSFIHSIKYEHLRLNILPHTFESNSGRAVAECVGSLAISLWLNMLDIHNYHQCSCVCVRCGVLYFIYRCRTAAGPHNWFFGRGDCPLARLLHFGGLM